MQLPNIVILKEISCSLRLLPMDNSRRVIASVKAWGKIIALTILVISTLRGCCNITLPPEITSNYQSQHNYNGMCKR